MEILIKFGAMFLLAWFFVKAFRYIYGMGMLKGLEMTNDSLEHLEHFTKETLEQEKIGNEEFICTKCTLELIREMKITVNDTCKGIYEEIRWKWKNK